MDSIKSATATGKEKVQNLVAKADLKVEKNKVAAAEKAERKAASDQAGKHEAKAKRHTKEAELFREYEKKRAENAAVKEQKHAALSQKQADKHSSSKTGGAAPTHPSRPIESIGASFGEALPPDYEPTGVEAPIPMHGSGVPTHSALHHEEHDPQSMKTMDGARNTGSYMV